MLAEGHPLRVLALLPRRMLAALVRAYQLFFSAWVGNVCRYAPSCSHYALQALNRHGALGGTALASWRLLRCNPWSPGGDDPVPAQHPFAGLFTRLPLRAGDDSCDPEKAS
jgi:putative membrane protein insertion efficiency factor